MKDKENQNPKFMRIFSALDLITIGIVLLLNTTGVISWKIWVELLRFWPLFIVSAGIGILFDFSIWSKVIGKIITYLLFLAMLFFAGVNTINNSTVVDDFRNGLPNFFTNSLFVFNTSNNDQNKETVYSIADFQEIKELGLKLYNTKGTLTVTDANSDNTIFGVNASYSQYDSEYTIEKSVENEKMNLIFDSGEITNGFMNFSNSAPKYDFVLGNFLQNSNLELKLGAGETRIDLSKIQLTTLKANTAAGKLIANFSDNALPTSMELEVGAGEMEITIPKDAGYKLKYSVGVGGVKIDGQNVGVGLGSKDTLVSDNYSNSTRKVDIKLDVAVGSFSLNFK